MEIIKYFKALADETRLRIFSLLLDHELNVNELVTVLDMGQPRISRHLKVLAESRLISVRKDGLWSFYGVSTSEGSRRFIQSVRYIFMENSVFSLDRLKAVSIIQERQKETRRFFDSVAEEWDIKKREVIGNFDIVGEIVKRIPKCHVALDAGCGTGDLIVSLLEKASKVIGVDDSPRMLDKAQKSISLLKLNKRINLRIGRLEHLPMRDRETDVVVINMVLHHIPDPFLAIRDVYRVLNTNGLLVLIELDKHADENLRTVYKDRWLGFRQQDIKNWLEKAGFGIQKVEFFDIHRELKAGIYAAVRS